MQRVTLILACAVIFVLALSIQTNAAAPQLINYQGVLADSTGAGLDTTVSMVFTIYDAPTLGTSVWTETQMVTTTDGLFSILLGSMSPILDTVFNGATRYLSIEVAGDAELSPRTALGGPENPLRVPAAGAVDPSAPSTVADPLLACEHRSRGFYDR